MKSAVNELSVNEPTLFELALIAAAMIETNPNAQFSGLAEEAFNLWNACSGLIAARKAKRLHCMEKFMQIPVQTATEFE